MANHKIPLQFPAVMLLVIVSGCHVFSSTANPRIVNQFTEIETLLILTDDPEPIKVTDPVAIRKLQTIYTQARWELFIDTMPADVVAIKCMRNHKESFRLLFGAGWLIEWDPDNGGTRKSILDEQAVDWLSQLTKQAEITSN